MESLPPLALIVVPLVVLLAKTMVSLRMSVVTVARVTAFWKRTSSPPVETGVPVMMRELVTDFWKTDDRCHPRSRRC